MIQHVRRWAKARPAASGLSIPLSALTQTALLRGSRVTLRFTVLLGLTLTVDAVLAPLPLSQEELALLTALIALDQAGPGRRAQRSK